ncbi:cilium assembly protein DZIP1L [Bombina bombina]|uniref:cilium assembly protein DZIP1L n=1 Tax=Bombina bombina TaxID=8345 RepID=UPI00235AC6F0|nr:cilium assembly protein DZIP1L [Bombina bombina]
MVSARYRQHSLKMPGYIPTSAQHPANPYIISPKGTMQTFRFQPRRDGIDWRRFSAIDVERVAREMDVSTLQENISSITFCNLDGEKCPYCQQPVDPVLLKVLKMAQFTIEYLLCSQEYLSSAVAQLEERVVEADTEHQKTKDEMMKQAEELKMVKEENKRRKKLIATQQMLLQAGANNYHKCQLCDKAFTNYSYLQGHVQRRHPEITEAEREKKKQVAHMEDGIEELKIKLQKTQAQLEEEREMEQKHRKQEMEEVNRREEHMKRDFERWKEEERFKFQEEMVKMRQLFLAQIQDITIKNSTFESRFQDLETYKSKSSSLGNLEDEDDRRARQKMQEELRRLRDEIEQQQAEWKKKLKETKRDYNIEKDELLNENERLRASLSNDQKTRDQQFDRQIQTLRSQIKDQSQLIKTHEQTIRNLSSFKEVPKVVSTVGSARPDDSSEEEPDTTLDQSLKHIHDLRMNSEFIRQFRPILEEALIEKLESMGVKKGAKGVPSATHKGLTALLANQLDQKLRKFPDIQTLRLKLSKEVTKKVKQWRKEEDNFQLSTSLHSAQSLSSPRGVLTSEQKMPKARNVQVVESRADISKVPVPSPRTKVIENQNTSRITNVAPPPPPSRTPPFTSEEDTSLYSPTRQASPRQKSILQAQAEEDSDDWSDFDTSLDKPKSVTFSTGIGTQGTMVQSLTKSLERQLSEQRRKPVGGIDIVNAQSRKSPNKSKTIEKLQLSDESDSEFSSLEEITENLGVNEKKPQTAVRHSTDSAGSQGTSLWSSGSIKAGVW